MKLRKKCLDDAHVWFTYHSGLVVCRICGVRIEV